MVSPFFAKPAWLSRRRSRRPPQADDAKRSLAQGGRSPPRLRRTSPSAEILYGAGNDELCHTRGDAPLTRLGILRHGGSRNADGTGAGGKFSGGGIVGVAGTGSERRG